MKSFVLQPTNLGSRKQRVQLTIVAVIGLLQLVAVVVEMLDFDSPEGGTGFLLHRKYPVAALGPGAAPPILSAGTWSNGSDRVHALQVTLNTNVWYWELHLGGAP
jgi:hypothetical protein